VIKIYVLPFSVTGWIKTRLLIICGYEKEMSFVGLRVVLSILYGNKHNAGYFNTKTPCR